MVNQALWIGIAVGAFIVGIGIGYVIFLNTYQPDVMMTQTQLMQQLMMQSPQHRQQMMEQMLEDPDLRQHMMETVTQDPQQMRTWMANTQHIKEMSEVMKENHDFMMEMMQVIMEDPSLRLQMLGHMTENQEVMEQMRELMGSGGMMGNDMMGPGMMGMVSDTNDLINKLKQKEANVVLGDEINQPFFSVIGKTILVDDAQLQVFEYPTQARAEEDASKVSPDGHSIGLSMPLWVETPHFYQKEKIIVLYVGNDSAIIELLESVLGTQFAGG